jgi:hypothetical protein
MLHNNSPFWIASVIVVIVNLRKLIGCNLPIKYKVLLFISGTIYFVTFGVYVYHGDMIGRHDVLLEGYIQNGAYFVAKPAHAPVQISEWDYKFNLILGIGTIVSLIVHIIVGIFVFWEE